MQQYDDGSRGPLGSLFSPFKYPGSYKIALQFLYAGADGYEDTRLDWNDKHFSDSLIWHLRPTDTSLQLSTRQHTLTESRSHSEKPAIASRPTCSAVQ